MSVPASEQRDISHKQLLPPGRSKRIRNESDASFCAPERFLAWRKLLFKPDLDFVTHSCFLARCEHAPLVFHDEAYRVLHLAVFWSAASLQLRLHSVSLVLDVFQCVLHQVTHSAVLRRIQSLDVLQDVQNLTDRI